MAEEYFQTKIFVDDAYYDAEEQMALLFVTILMTGEKRILTQPKSDYHCRDGVPGDFPDSEMYKFVENMKGKQLIWKLYTDPNVQKMTEDSVEHIAKRVGVQMDELKEVIGSDERILDRKKEDLMRISAQEEAIRRLRSSIQRG